MVSEFPDEFLFCWCQLVERVCSNGSLQVFLELWRIFRGCNLGTVEWRSKFVNIWYLCYILYYYVAIKNSIAIMCQSHDLHGGVIAPPTSRAGHRVSIRVQFNVEHWGVVSIGIDCRWTDGRHVGAASIIVDHRPHVQSQQTLTKEGPAGVWSKKNKLKLMRT